MALVATDNKYYAAIAAAIREKSGSTSLYKPSEMAAAILALEDGGFFPSILVTGLSETDTVTAMKDGKTVNGVWSSTESRFEISKIRELGTWTVTATDGSKTATQDVLVDAATEYEILMDLYKLWLYREGEECEGVTGGWTHKRQESNNSNGTWTGGTVTLSKNTDNMLLSVTASSSYQSAVLVHQTPVDLTGYTKLCVEYGDITGTSPGSNRCNMAVSNSGKDFYYPDSGDCVATMIVNASHESIFYANSVATMDISKINGEKYISPAFLYGVYGSVSTQPAKSAVVKNVWLE